MILHNQSNTKLMPHALIYMIVYLRAQLLLLDMRQRLMMIHLYCLLDSDWFSPDQELLMNLLWSERGVLEIGLNRCV